MTERTVELDKPQMRDEATEAVRTATERAERAEAELAKLKSHASAHEPGTIASANELKQPPSPSTAANAAGAPSQQHREQGKPEIDGHLGGESELRKDPMMAHLLDALAHGTDVGHYGRLVFAMVARHFMPHDEVLAWLTKDKDFTGEQARQMLHQVEGRDYSPPRRERLMEWQHEQEFQFIDVDDPDSGNLYRNLKFPHEIYEHIGHYQEAKTS